MAVSEPVPVSMSEPEPENESKSLLFLSRHMLVSLQTITK